MVKHYTMRTHEDVWRSGSIAPPFLTSALDGTEWLGSRLDRFTPRERALDNSSDRRLLDPRTGLRRCGVQKNLALPVGPNVRKIFFR
jgi:hypothetical protein